MDQNSSQNTGKIPIMHGGITATSTSVTDWWPNTLNLDILHVRLGAGSQLVRRRGAGCLRPQTE